MTDLFLFADLLRRLRSTRVILKQVEVSGALILRVVPVGFFHSAVRVRCKVYLTASGLVL
jgi:hypothetical protein